MEKHFVGSEIGQLRSVMLHRPNLSLKRLTPSNCQELLFDDVLSVERAGEEHDIFANTLRQQGIEVLLLTDLLTQTLDVADAKAWLLDTQISDYRLGPTFAADIRAWLADMPHRELARHLSGGLTYGEIPASIKNMVVDTHDINDFIMKPLPNHLFTRDTSCWIYNGVSINPMAKPARQRETNNLRAIYRWHPQFAGGDFIKYFGDEDIIANLSLSIRQQVMVAPSQEFWITTHCRKFSASLPVAVLSGSHHGSFSARRWYTNKLIICLK